MKINLRQLVNASAPLGMLIQKEMKISTSFKLSKILKIVNVELELFQEKRNEIVKKYSDPKPDEKGNVQINDIPNFNKETNELLSIEIEIDIQKISIKDLEEESIKISPIDITNMEFIFNSGE